MIKKDKIDELASVLLAGGKMLSQHCPKCKTPLFEYEEKIICPVCGGEVVEEETTPKERDSGSGEVVAKAEGKPATELKRIAQNKLAQLEDKLEDENDPEKVNEILKAIKSTLDVLERLKER
ncbi:hypothetical protein AKJ42_00145 [candidate division MSBL1 archaeon SCGC-AAA261C02]|nr:hypothetical protein AKJ42_00145 [candidate division MSBL1 archaeon SCGC-AAA261C02]